VAQPKVVGRTGSTWIFCGHEHVWPHVYTQNPLGFGAPQRCSMVCPKEKRLDRISPVRPGLTKQTARYERRPLAGFGLVAARDTASGSVAGVAGAGGLNSRARGDAGQEARVLVRRSAGGCACACARGCAARHRFGSARARISVGSPAGSAAAARTTAPSTGETPRVLRRDGTRRSW
jgi:hypothetical protein